MADGLKDQGWGPPGESQSQEGHGRRPGWHPGCSCATVSCKCARTAGIGMCVYMCVWVCRGVDVVRVCVCVRVVLAVDGWVCMCVCVCVCVRVIG